MQTETEKKLLTYLRKIAPKEAEGKEIILKDSAAISIENEGVRSLVMMIQSVYLTSGDDGTSKLRDLVVTLASALRENEIKKRVNDLWEGKIYGLPVPRIERMLKWQGQKNDASRTGPGNLVNTTAGNVLVGNTSKPTARVSYNGKTYLLVDLDENLKKCRHEILAAFYELYFRYNIPAPSNFGKFEGTEDTGLPSNI